MTSPPVENLTPLVIIIGPTASGKSALGVWLAGRLGGEVVSCDSTQVYRGFDIGTAKPTAAERRSVPHHLIDLLEAHEVFTAGDYRRHATGVLADLKERGKLPVLVAGTGLYLRALLEGLSDAPLRSEELRKRLMTRADRRRPGHLHRLLKKMDPGAAAKIAPQDTPKLIRAIEVCVLAGKPLSEVHRSGRQRLEGVRPLKIGLMPDRNALYERIERRTAEMIERGWRDEVRGLACKGIAETAKPFSFIGYKELRANLEGKLELPKAVAAIQQATRRYAKRQLTWFRKERDVRWFEGFGDDANVMQAVLQHLQEELGIARKTANLGT
jgi:tRNA dimethylallyltransferase